MKASVCQPYQGQVKKKTDSQIFPSSDIRFPESARPVADTLRLPSTCRVSIPSTTEPTPKYDIEMCDPRIAVASILDQAPLHCLVPGMPFSRRARFTAAWYMFHLSMFGDQNQSVAYEALPDFHCFPMGAGPSERNCDQPNVMEVS